jgi:TolB-like protein
MIAWAPGTALGPYELISRLGAGGMGEVWKARDTRVGRIVAIKRLNGEHAEGFKREARAIAALNHPHICQLYDVGPDYLVMEYVDGPILTGPMPVADAQRVATQIADALAAAHQKGIVHRDLKPANILISERGAKLLAFGLALIDGPASIETTISVAPSRPGVVIGTVAYMSPEQAQGQAVDARSDVFSFGAVLYEMLSGRRAFARETALASLSAVVNDVPARLAAPATLERIVSRCLAKHPRDRFQSMTEVASALEQTLHGSSRHQPSIAVLPFANMSRDSDDEFFSDGLAEEIINLLAKVPNLKVTARTSSFAFRGKEQDIRQVGDALGVRTILEGSVRRAGSRIRVTAQLIGTEDGYHLWSERYDRELTDVFAIQDDIAEAIAGALKTTLVARPARHTPTVPAYDALLKARQLIRAYEPEAHARARGYCQQAIALDPLYAAPHALLAFISLHSTTHTGRPMPAVAPEIRRAAERALELDPLETDPHFLLGLVAFAHDYDWSEAEREFEIALRSPSPPAEAHWSRACFLSTFARFEEACAEMRRTVELDR